MLLLFNGGWNGGSAYFGTIGISVDSLVRYWTDWNVCDETPDIDTLSDRVNDGLRFIRYTYTGGDAEFQLLKVVGGTHDWYQDSTAHDIDYFDEIHRFFTGGASSVQCSTLILAHILLSLRRRLSLPESALVWVWLRRR